MAESVTIDCKYKMEKNSQINVPEEHKETLPLNYSCHAKISEKCDASNVVIGVSNNHTKKKSLSDVRYLDFFNRSVPEIPTSLEKFFPDIQAFSVWYAGLKKVSKKVLKYPKLILLNLSHNNLESLDSDLFEFVPNIDILFLDHNPMSHVGLNILDSLHHLKKTITMHTWKCKVHTTIHDFEKNLEQKIKDLKQELKQKCPPKQDDEVSNEINIGEKEENIEQNTDQPKATVEGDGDECECKCECQYEYQIKYTTDLAKSNGIVTGKKKKNINEL